MYDPEFIKESSRGAATDLLERRFCLKPIHSDPSIQAILDSLLQEFRKSYKVAFILFAPEGTDITTPEFQGQLNKLDDIKTAFSSQFITSTEGMGIVNVSYPTVVLMPPGPVYGIHDEPASLMWEFLRESIVNYFFMPLINLLKSNQNHLTLT